MKSWGAQSVFPIVFEARLMGWKRRIALLLMVAGQDLVDDRTAIAGRGCSTLFEWSSNADSGQPDNRLAEPLVTDRPDFTESSTTVGSGVVQLETGYTYTYDSHATGSTREQTYPEALLRLGMFADWFEFRLAWGLADLRDAEFGGPINSASGSEDLDLGAKLALTPQACCLPEMAVLLEMSVPSGSSGLTAGDVLPSVAWLYGWDINDRWSAGGQTLFSRALDDVTSEPYLEFSQSWTVGYSWTDRLRNYTEWYMFAPDGADTNRNQQYFDGGFTFLLNDNLQWDVRAGLGLNDAANDYFVGSGLSVRWY
jgi:Putative MetA-pathway of phenol degradation